MNISSTILMSLGLCLVFGSSALAQDTEYLLEGVDREQGPFTGRLKLTTGPGGKVKLDRRVEFRNGQAIWVGGKGKRKEDTIKARFVFSAGLTGSVAGSETPKPVLMRIVLGVLDDDTAEAGEWIETHCRRANKPKSSGDGYRVTLIEKEQPAPESSSHSYKKMLGKAFIKGGDDPYEVDVNDVSQGGLGDCYFIAGISAVAAARPHRVRSMIEDHGDGTFSVYLWKHDYQWEEEVIDDEGFFTPSVRATKIVVDDSFPSSFGSSPAYADFGDSEEVDGKILHELWPMILEKAYAKHKGSYSIIEGGWASTPISFFSGRDAVIDHDPKELSEEKLAAILKEAADKKYPTTFGVPEGGGDSSLNLYGNHYYIFLGVDEEGRALLRNPWGSSHPPRALTMPEVKKIFDAIHVGEL